MKRPISLLSMLLLIVSTVSAQTPPVLSPGARLLFTNVKTRLTTADKNQLFQKSGLSVSNDKKHLVGDDDPMTKFPYAVRVYPTDLNGDGSEDVFILYGNPALSANAGADLTLLIRNKSGEFQMNLGFPATVPDALTTTSLGYPDLLIGGPGFEHPVWRWNGKKYEFHRKIKDQEYERTPKTNAEALSRSYVNTVTNSLIDQKL